MSNNSIDCKVCGKTVASMKGLSKHLTMSHKNEVSHYEYYTRYLMAPGENICPYCGNERIFSGQIGKGFANTCGSDECVLKANRDGVSSAWAAKDDEYWKQRQEKTRKTNLERYGVEHHTQDPSVIEKRVETNLQRYGVVNNSQTQDWRDKVTQTSMKKYGKPHFLSSEEVIAKRKETNLQRYGVENVFQVGTVKERIKKTLQERYGDGIINPTQSFEVKAKVFTDEWRAKIRSTHTKLAREQGHYPRYNERGCAFFSTLNDVTGTNGQHATNGGEYFIESLGYYLDYINHELRLIIEWDESHHYTSTGELRGKDLKRQEEIQAQFPDYVFLRVNEDQAPSDPLDLIPESQG